MKMRTVSNLLKHILSRITNQNDLNEIRTRIRNLAGCSRFDYRKEKKEEQDDEDDEFDQLSVDITYLNGKQIDVILLNFERILD